MERSARDSAFVSALTALINKHSIESDSDTPDYILAEHLYRCLNVFNFTTEKRTKWYQKEI